MAALQFEVTTASEVVLVADTAKTVMRIKAPANQKVKILSWSVMFDSTISTTEPVVVELIRTSASGTASSTTPAKTDESDSTTIQTTADKNFTVETTASQTLDVKNIHPQSGYEKVYGLGQEMIIGGGGMVAIRCTAPGAGVNCIPHFACEE